MSNLVKKKENVENVWLTCLALYIYTKKLSDQHKDKVSLNANACIIFLTQNQIAKPEIFLNSITF